MSAEDGSFKIYRDYMLRGKPVVEVRVNDNIIDMRGVLEVRKPDGSFRHPKWHVVQKLVIEWLLAHDCEEAKSAKWGFWVYDPSPPRI
jgi:hypothetical protein